MKNKYLLLMLLCAAVLSSHSCLKSKRSDAENERIINQACNYFMTKDFEKAIEYFSLYIEDNKTDKSAYALRGICYYILKRYPEALEDSNMVIQLEPDNCKNYILRGDSWKKLNNLQKACEDFQKAKELGCDDAEEDLKKNKCTAKP